MSKMQCFMAEEITYKIRFYHHLPAFYLCDREVEFLSCFCWKKSNGNVKVQLLGTDRDESSFCHTSGDF